MSYSEQDGVITKTICVGEHIQKSQRRRADSSRDLAAAWSKAFMVGEPISQVGASGEEIRSAELFCGSGGLGIGVKEAATELGYRYSSVACLDHDPEAVEVYAANHGSSVRSSCSVTEIVDYNVHGQGENAEFLYEPELLDAKWAGLIGRVDVLLAGPPCQGHSNLNNRTRRTDKRNQLYLTVPAVAIALEVNAVVIENVQAVVHDRTQVVSSAAHLLKAAGYHIEVGVVSAADIGWPQTRKRYFLVARRDRPPVPLSDVSNALRTQPQPVSWAFEDLPAAGTGHQLHVATELSEENLRRINFLFDHDLHDLPNSERPECHQDGTTYGSVYGRLHADRPAPTITTGFLTPGRGRYIHPHERRTLTPLEAARIQGFPDAYNFAPDPRQPATKAKLTKWIGDAVPMPLGYVAGLSAFATCK